MTNEVTHEAIGIERAVVGDGFGASNGTTLVSLVDLLDQWSPLGRFHLPEMRFDSRKPTRLETLWIASLQVAASIVCGGFVSRLECISRRDGKHEQ